MNYCDVHGYTNFCPVCFPIEELQAKNPMEQSSIYSIVSDMITEWIRSIFLSLIIGVVIGAISAFITNWMSK